MNSAIAYSIKSRDYQSIFSAAPTQPQPKCSRQEFYNSTNNFENEHNSTIFFQATGPLTQATGALRSDAGVGIGILRGISLLSAN